MGHNVDFADQRRFERGLSDPRQRHGQPCTLGPRARLGRGRKRG